MRFNKIKVNFIQIIQILITKQIQKKERKFKIKI